MSVPTPPSPRRRAPSRRDPARWRQATEGIGLVVVLAGLVMAGGFVLALLVSLLF